MAKRILARELTPEDLTGRSLRVKYEANGVDQWRLFFDRLEIHLITADYVPTKLLDMEGYFIKDNGIFSVWSEKGKELLLGWLKDFAKWKIFVSGIAGATATGGPTGEQLVEGWIKLGNQIKLDYGWCCLKNPTQLFVPHQECFKRCFGYWLASPSAYYSNSVMYVAYGGGMGYSNYRDGNLGVRPLVTLPADVVLQYDEELQIWLIV